VTKKADRVALTLHRVAFLGYNITILNREAIAMTTIISLYLFAFLFLVAFGALAVAFANYMTRKIPSAPGATKGANNEAKRLD